MNKLKEIIINKKTIFVFALILAGIMFIIYTHSNIAINGNEINNVEYYLMSFIALVLCISIIILLLNKKIKTHILFLVVGTIFGIIYLVIAPIFNGSDEVAHFYRTYQVSVGQFITNQDGDGNYIERDIPKSFLELSSSKNSDMSIKLRDISEKEKIKLNKNETTNKPANIAASIYSPIVYIPQAIGVAVGVLLNLNPFIIVNISRIAIFIVWLLGCTYAIKIMPRKKEFLFILALLPASLTSAVTLSADSVLNATVFILIAKIFQVILGEGKIKLKDYIIILICSIIISQCKIAYIPLIFLSLLILPSKYKSKKNYIIGNIVIIILSLLSALIWLKLSSAFFDGMSTTNQKEWILQNPFEYCIIMFRTIMEYFTKLSYGTAAGNILYQARVYVPDFISFSLLMCLVISLFTEKSDIKLNIWQKIILFGLSIGMSVLILTSMYASATPIITGVVGNKIIEGTQGRYFIPIIALACLYCTKKRVSININYVYAMSIFLQFCVTLSVLQIFI